MRKLAKVSGIVTTSMVVLGILLKMKHFPGGGILTVLGTGFFILLFLPSLTFYKIKSAKNKNLTPIYILGLIGGWALAASLLFSIQHWPLTAMQLLIGLIASGIFLALYLATLLKDASEEKKFGIFDVLIVLAFGMLFLGKNFAIQSTADIKKQITFCDSLQFARDKMMGDNYELIQNFQKNSQNDSVSKSVYDNAMMIHQKTKEIFDYIMRLRGKLIGLSAGLPDNNSGDTLRLELLDHPNDYDNPTHFMIGSDFANITGEAKPLKDSIVLYYVKLPRFLSETSQKDFTSKILKFIPADSFIDSTNDKITSWEPFHFYRKNVIECATEFVQLQIDVLTAEKLALQELKKESENK